LRDCLFKNCVKVGENGVGGGRTSPHPILLFFTNFEKIE
jgi:hypothetical protein